MLHCEHRAAGGAHGAWAYIFLEHDDALVTLLSRPALPAEPPGVHTQLGSAGMGGIATPMARANVTPGRRCSAPTCDQERGGDARWSRDPPVLNLAVNGTVQAQACMTRLRALSVGLQRTRVDG